MARNGVAMFRLFQRPGAACGHFVMKTRVNNLSYLHPVAAQSRWSSSKTNGDTAAEIVQSFQGGEHQFSSSRARENLSEAMDTGTFPNQGNVNQPTQSGNSMKPRKEFAGKDEHVGKYDSQGTVHLYSVMQSTVPEPFQPGGKSGSSPTHLNMPGGGVKLKDKYLNDKRVQDTYQSMESVFKRKFSTSVSHAATIIDLESDIPCPQGIQGSESDQDCTNFKLWLENCRRYGFSSCVEQLEGIQSGRKTLHQVFAEQEEVIRQIAQSYYTRTPTDPNIQGVQGSGASTMQAPDIQGLQGAIPEDMSLQELATTYSMTAPCPQGVQGDECIQFKLWLQNCVQWGIGDCQQQLDDLRAGRRTLAQVFAEQEQLIRDVAMQYSATASQAGAGPASGSPERD